MKASKMKISKKQAVRLSQLINAVSVYTGIVSRDMEKPGYDVGDVRRTMKWADEQIEALNTEFGTTLTGYYVKPNVSC